MARIVYTDDHIKYLEREYLKNNVRNLTQKFNAEFGMDKTEAAIATVLYKRQIKCGRTGKEKLYDTRYSILTPEQDAFVRAAYKKMSALKITKALNEKYNADFKTRQINAYLRNHGIKSGRLGRFKKGNRPWNDKTKGLGISKASSGSFKPGNVPATLKPLYSERETKDGTIEIKVPVPHKGKGTKTRYMHKQRWVYMQHKGAIPSGFVVSFKDGDNKNFEPDNLILLSRAEMLRMNKNGYRQMPDEIKPTVLALSKLQAKISAKNKEILE